MRIILWLLPFLIWGGCVTVDTSVFTLRSSALSKKEALEAYPKVSDDADTILNLHSNIQKTTFYVNSKKMATGKRVKILINKKRSYNIVAQPAGYIAKEEFIQPPYMKGSPLSFTYLMGDKVSGKTQDVGESPERAASVITDITSDVDINIPKTGIKNKNAVAVVIGNRNYVSRDIPSVDFAVNDAETMKKYLVNVLGYREGNVLYQPNASKATFESIFGTRYDHKGKLYNYLIEGESDIFIFYSGHGAPDLKKKDGYFVPVDADPQTISLTGYPLKQLYENIAKIAEDKKTPNIYIVVDACFSGSSEKGLLLKNASPITIEVKNPLVSRTNTVVFTSSSGAEISSWYPEKGHSMFTYFFLKALQEKARKKGTVTAGDLFNYITNKSEGVPYYARRLHGRIQTPQLTGNSKKIMFSK